MDPRTRGGSGNWSCCYSACSATSMTIQHIQWRQKGSSTWGWYLESLAGPCRLITAQAFRILGQSPATLCGYQLFLWETALYLLLSLSRACTLSHGPSYQAPWAVPHALGVTWDSPGYNAGHTQQRSIVKWKWYRCDRAQEGCDGPGKLLGRSGPNGPWFPLQLYYILSPSLTYGLLGEFLMIKW